MNSAIALQLIVVFLIVVFLLVIIAYQSGNVNNSSNTVTTAPTQNNDTVNPAQNTTVTTETGQTTTVSTQNNSSESSETQTIIYEPNIGTGNTLPVTFNFVKNDSITNIYVPRSTSIGNNSTVFSYYSSRTPILEKYRPKADVIIPIYIELSQTQPEPRATWGILFFESNGNSIIVRSPNYGNAPGRLPFPPSGVFNIGRTTGVIIN